MAVRHGIVVSIRLAQNIFLASKPEVEEFVRRDIRKDVHLNLFLDKNPGEFSIIVESAAPHKGDASGYPLTSKDKGLHSTVAVQKKTGKDQPEVHVVTLRVPHDEAEYSKADDGEGQGS
ncbi:hypothetical protein SCP_1000440 [Sparassis crispa]|uniref:Uncharacterized protein n=1 Tax=Sparassis crispa TaxID=139825 RepID=A0A401GX94_9APHY|nr:hypothetical protein SCP_1000440 [Sparassis crispa]GBE86802.1 hypothetical protein SCP_1000440 [Sparassis crispa]